jgi:hypothetical protein
VIALLLLQLLLLLLMMMMMMMMMLMVPPLSVAALSSVPAPTDRAAPPKVRPHRHRPLPPQRSAA